jgi:putative tryptophan/tyrosine transport system substrate-binding protein
MDRRVFVAGMAVMMAAPLSAGAQQAGKPVRIGWISATPRDRDRGPEHFRPAVEHHLRQSGWDPRFELRYAGGDLDRLAVMAEELARARPDVIVAPDTNGAVAAKKAMATVPIVMSSADPVGAGLVASLARPGGNVTGVSAFFDDGVAGKWVEFLRELGAASSLAVVWNPGARTAAERLGAIERAAADVGLRVHRLEIRSEADVDRVIQTLARTSVGGLIYDPDLTLIPYTGRVIEAARRQRVPSVVGFAPQVLSGGLLAYGPSLPDLYRLIAVYVDKILRGAKPSELPVEQVRKHDLVINMKTAKALGLTIPPALLLRADHLIE